MPNLLNRLNDLAAPYGVSVELVDFPIGKPGYVAVLKSSRELSTEEVEELTAKLTEVSSQIRRVVLDITQI